MSRLALDLARALDPVALAAALGIAPDDWLPAARAAAAVSGRLLELEAGS